MSRNVQARTHHVRVLNRTALKACASIAVLAAFSPAHAVALDFLSFTTTGNFTGWTTLGTTSGSSATLKTMTVADQVTLGDGIHGDKIKRLYSLTPATGQYMAKIQPYSSATYLNAADAVFGLTNGTFTNVFTALSGRPTNYGALTETITLAPGSYTFYWAYAAQDYHPYNDGVLFALSGNGLNKVDVLASNGDNDSGGGGAQATTVVVGTFGATQWAAHSFDISSQGTYQLSFVAYNWGPTSSLSDTAVNPLLYIGASAGTVTQGAAKPIDTTAAYYSASGLGSTVLPDFKGGTLRVDASGNISSAFTVGAYSGNAIDAYGNTGIFSGVLAGTGGLILKDSVGGGRVVFTGANTYTGGTTINAGATLQIGGGGTTGAIAGDITDNGTLAFNRSDAITYSGVVSGSGSLIQAGSGTLILTGANTYTGGTTISAGTLQIGDGNTSGSIAGDITDNGVLGFNRSDAVTYAGVISGTGSLTKQGTGSLILTGANTYTGGTTIAAGTLQIGNGSTTGSITGNIANGGTLAFNHSNSITYSGVISGTGSVSVSGGGTAVLTGSNTYTGQTSIAAGSTLQLGNGGTTGSIVSDVSNQGILAFNRSDTVTFTGNVSGDGTLVQNGTGKVIVTTNYTGKTIVNSGTLQIGNGSSSGTITGNIINNATVIYGQAAATSYSGIISGTGGVNVSGSGVVILNGSNTYTGPTTVTAGSLIIGDSTHQSATVLSGVTVSNNAIIGGYGVIGGNLVASGGIVSPGNSIGTLTVNGNYTQSSSSTLAIEVTPTANDKLVVNGTAQLGGTLALTLAQGNYGTRAISFLTAGSINGTFSTVTYNGTANDMVYGIVYAPKEIDLAMTPKSSGQVYGDLVTAGLDTAVMLNRTVLDRLDTASGPGWSAWSNALSGASHTDGTDTLADFNSQLWGVISGVDYRLGGGTKLSGVFSYTHSQLGVHGDKASVEGYFFALAGHVPANTVAIDVTAFLQHNVVDTIRNKGGAGDATGNTSNLVGGGSVQISYPAYGGDILPFARLSVASFGTDAFTESGTLGFAVGSLERTSVRSSLGLKASHTYITEDGTHILPRVLIGIENELARTNRDTSMTFATTAFTAPAPAPTSVSALLGAGLAATFEDQLEFSLDTSWRLSSRQREGIASFGARYRF